MNNFYSPGEFIVSKSLWFKWVKARYAIEKIEIPIDWQDKLEDEFKNLDSNITSIKWIE